MKHIAFATVNRSGAPRVMPLDSLFLHGRFHWTTDSSARRVADLRRDPRCSAVHWVGDDLMVAVHGTSELIGPAHPEFRSLEEIWHGFYGSYPSSWGPAVVHGRIQPTHMYAWAHHPENYPELDS